MPHYFIDSHAHLYLDQFAEDIDIVVERAYQQAVTKVLLPNIDMNSVASMFALCDRYPEMMLPMVGLHPCFVDITFREVLDKLYPFLEDPRVIAVGEMGTDLYWDKTYIEEQKEAFGIQCTWAKERDLPIVIHCRDSIDMTIDLVRKHQDGRLKGVFHCFGGSFQQAEEIIDLGFMLGIGGVSTFKKSIELREVLSQVPLSSLILETDAPYLAPHPYRGKRNESSYIPIIAKVLSDVKNISIQDIALATSGNVTRLFNLL